MPALTGTFPGICASIREVQMGMDPLEGGEVNSYLPEPEPAVPATTGTPLVQPEDFGVLDDKVASLSVAQLFSILLEHLRLWSFSSNHHLICLSK